MAISRACERSRELVSLELDGELSSFEAALLRRHLAGCASCARYAEDVRAATGLLRAAPLVELSQPALALPARHRSRRFGHVPVAVAGLAAAAAAAAAIAVGGLGGSTPQPGSTSESASATGTDLGTMREIRRQTLPPPASPTNVRIRVIEVD